MANYIEFIVDKQIIRRFDNEAVVQDSQNYLSAMFTFTEESEGWEGEVTAVFKGADGQAFNVLLDSEGMCLVPWEVLTGNYFDVSLFCGDLITANVVRVFAIKSGYEIGQESREPTPDVYNQIIEKIDGINAFSVPYENEELGVENVGDALDVLAEGGGGGGGGTTPNIHMTAEVDATTGTPDVEVTKTGTLTNPIFNLAFSGLKGETGSQGPQGIQGEAGPQGERGPQGIQGPTGETGSQGPKGDTGATPIISASATVSNTTGTPSVNVSKSGTDEAPSFAFAFSNLKGETGSQGPQGIQGIQGPTGPQGPKGDAGADGSVVTVTQTLSSGTKIAEIDVDGTTTNLYAPNRGGSASALDDLTDVEVTNPTSGQILKYNGTEWVNGEGGSSTVSNDTDFIYVAHRGLFGSAQNNIPENTLEAFINALNDGYKWLEVDIRRSSDGVWVMAHDPRIDVYDSNGTATRVTISEKTLAELQTYTYDANGVYHISVFANVLCQLKKYNAKIIIDNKVTSPNYEEELFNMIHACGMTQNAILTISIDWGLENLDILTANKKNPIRINVSDYTKAKTLIDSIENDVYIDMNVSNDSGRNVTLPMVTALNRPIITAGISTSWNSAQNKHAINAIAGGMTAEPVTYEQMKNGLNYQIGYSDITVTGADPYIDVGATSYQITVANNDSGSGYVNTYTADPLIASTTINTIGTTSQATITAQSKGRTNAYILNGSVCRAIRVQSAPNGFWIAGDVGNNDHAFSAYDNKAILLEFTHENSEKIVVSSSAFNTMHRYNLEYFNSYNVKMPTIPEGATKFYASFLNDVAGQFYIKFFTEDFVATSDGQGWQSTKEVDIPSDAKYICITLRYSDLAKLMANNGNDPEARARFKALQDAVSYSFE